MTPSLQGTVALNQGFKGCLHNEDVTIGSNVIPTLVAAQCY